jgi:hypothetical protein
MSALSIRIGRGSSRLPADIALSLIPSLPRATLERLAQRIIDHLDDMDAPDEDREDDDPCGQMDEDELTTGPRVMATHGVTYDGPGCPIADAGEPDHRRSPRPTYDGEDCGAVILHAPKGFTPTTWDVS